MTDYQPLNSAMTNDYMAEVVQAAIERLCANGFQSCTHRLCEVRDQLRRTPKPAPTPEAERPALVGGEDGLRALMANWRGGAESNARSMKAPGVSDRLDEALRTEARVLRRCADELEAALSVPAALDGDDEPICCSGQDCYCLGATKGQERAWAAEQKAKQLPTPNAIRGDKGAEAVGDAREVSDAYLQGYHDATQAGEWPRLTGWAIVMVDASVAAAHPESWRGFRVDLKLTPERMKDWHATVCATDREEDWPTHYVQGYGKTFADALAKARELASVADLDLPAPTQAAAKDTP